MRILTFYYDSSGIGAVFPARLAALRRLMPDRRFTPARLAPGLGAVGLPCFEYRDSDVGPYGEVSISVALNDPWLALNVSGRAMLARVRRRQLHGLVQHLAVTSGLARDTGADIYNLPRSVEQIETSDSARSASAG